MCRESENEIANTMEAIKMGTKNIYRSFFSVVFFVFVLVLFFLPYSDRSPVVLRYLFARYSGR